MPSVNGGHINANNYHLESEWTLKFITDRKDCGRGCARIETSYPAQSNRSGETALTTMTNMQGDVLRIGEADASQALREREEIKR
ncbi:hypothetical protein [Paraburkholderia jirisanensis]